MSGFSGQINAETVANVGVSVTLAGMRRDAADMLGLASQDALAQDGSTWGTIKDAEVAVRKDYAQQWSRYRATMAPGRDTTDGNHFDAAFQKLSGLATKAGRMIVVGNSQMAGDLVLTDMAAAYSQFQDAIADDLANQSKETVAANARATGLVRSSFAGIVIVLVVMVALVLAVIWLMVLGRRPAGLRDDRGDEQTSATGYQCGGHRYRAPR